jgi:hypothetical protein
MRQLDALKLTYMNRFGRIMTNSRRSLNGHRSVAGDSAQKVTVVDDIMDVPYLLGGVLGDVGLW